MIKKAPARDGVPGPVAMKIIMSKVNFTSSSLGALYETILTCSFKRSILKILKTTILL